jgi:hypothetical protein
MGIVRRLDRLRLALEGRRVVTSRDRRGAQSVSPKIEYLDMIAHAGLVVSFELHVSEQQVAAD